MRDAISNLCGSDDAPHGKLLGQFNAALSGKLDTSGVDCFRGVNLKASPKTSQPCAILNVFVTRDYEPGPRLPNAESFHKMIISCHQTAARSGLK